MKFYAMHGKPHRTFLFSLCGVLFPQVLLKAFIANLKSSSPTVRRTAASSAVSICQHSRRTQHFYSWLLNVLLGKTCVSGIPSVVESPTFAGVRPLKSGHPMAVHQILGHWLIGKCKLDWGCFELMLGPCEGWERLLSSAEAWAQLCPKTVSRAGVLASVLPHPPS